MENKISDDIKEDLKTIPTDKFKDSLIDTYVQNKYSVNSIQELKTHLDLVFVNSQYQRIQNDIQHINNILNNDINYTNKMVFTMMEQDSIHPLFVEYFEKLRSKRYIVRINPTILCKDKVNLQVINRNYQSRSTYEKIGDFCSRNINEAAIILVSFSVVFGLVRSCK